MAQVGERTTTTETHCECYHLTAFAGGYIVVPNTIDFENNLMQFLTCVTSYTCTSLATLVFHAAQLILRCLVINAFNPFTRVWVCGSFYENPVGIIAVLTVYGGYLVLLLTARRRDRRNRLKAQPIDLADNLPHNKRVYVLTIFTGTRYGSGTTANVCAIIIGTKRPTFY